MKMTRIAGTAALALPMLMAGNANATEPGAYVSFGGGVNWIGEVESGGATLDFESGYSILGAFGYNFGDTEGGIGNFRLEGEVSWTQNDLDSISAGGVSANVGGELEQWGFMVNGLVDLFPDAGIRPYVGAGLGMIDGDVSATLGGVTVSSSGTEFAYRGLAGLGVPLGENTTLDVGYRYTRVTSDAEYDNHGVMAQIRLGL